MAKHNYVVHLTSLFKIALYASTKLYINRDFVHINCAIVCTKISALICAQFEQCGLNHDLNGNKETYAHSTQFNYY